MDDGISSDDAGNVSGFQVNGEFIPVSDYVPDGEALDIEQPFQVGYSTMTPLFDAPITEGDVIDEQLNKDLAYVKPAERDKRSRRTSFPDTEDVPREPKSGPPSIDEWARFFSRVVLRTFCDMYINYATRGIDEDMFSERDLDRLTLSDDERKLIATPFAELSSKSKFMRKHGRMIVASGDSFNALIVLGAWMSRVNRIAAKYRPRNVRMNGNGTVRPNSQPGSAPEANGFYGTSGGRIPNGFAGPIFPGNS